MAGKEKEMKYEITWKEGYSCCLANGEETTDEWSLKNLGIVGEIIYSNLFIITEDAIYAKLSSITLYDILMALTGGMELKADNMDKLRMKIKPLEEFKTDYPNFNKKNYDAFYGALDAYYDGMHPG